MSKYFLIARNIHDNSFQILELKEKWYLGCKGSDVFHKGCSLAAIDMVTSAFSSEKELIDRLVSNKYIDTSEVDLFIASKKNRDGQSYIKFYDLIYKPDSEILFNNWRGVCYATLNSDISEAKSNVLNIYDKLIRLVRSNEDFYYMINEGYTNIPKSIVELLSNVPYVGEESYSLKYKESWALHSYSTIRTFVESIEHYKDVAYSNSNFLGNNYGHLRMDLIPQLLRVLDKNYSENQLSLFDSSGELKNAMQFSSTASEIVKKEPVKEELIETAMVEKKEEKEVKRPEIVIPQHLNNEEKASKIFEILRRFPASALIRNDNKFEINTELFSYPLSASELNILNTRISSTMYKYIWTYSFYHEKYEEACINGWNSREYLEEMEWAKNGICRRLNNEKRLAKVYNWFMLWDGCIKRDEAYANCSLDTERGKVFEKK